MKKLKRVDVKSIIVPVKISKKMRAEMNRYLSLSDYKSRSEFIRDAIQEKINKDSWKWH